MSYCKHFEQGSGWFSSDYCNVSGKRETIPSTYFSYCKNEGYKCPWYENAYGTSGGCFITTVVCKLLKKKDDDPVMEGLRKFRGAVLQKDVDNYEILKEYDTVGPVLAEKLFRDKDREQIAETVYDYVLTPITELINEGKNEEAIEAYRDMTLLFINYYGLKHPYNELVQKGYEYESFDPFTAGHGIKTKKMNKKLDK